MLGPLPGSAVCSNRAATFTVSPVTNVSPAEGSPATTSPVLMPIRIWRSGAEVPLELGVERRQELPHLRGGAHRAERVVLVPRRHAEDRHDGVADELLDGPAVLLDPSASPRSSGT